MFRFHSSLVSFTLKNFHAPIYHLRNQPNVIPSLKLLPKDYNVGIRFYVASKIALNTISDNPKAVKEKRRLGRGASSGRGKKCGRGSGGQKSRSGNSKPRRGFEGGQTPLHKAFPKMAHDPSIKKFTLLPLDRLQYWIDRGRIDPNRAKRRLGRGASSGRGKKCGRGSGGQKSRSGNSKPRRGFEGGQTPLHKAFPKMAHDPSIKKFTLLPLDRLQYWIDRGRIDPNRAVSMKDLLDTRCVHGVKKDGVKITGIGSEYLKTPITIEVAAADRKSIAAIEGVGGHITCRYYTPLSLRATLYPEKFWRIPRFGRPMKKRDIIYYSDPENRGYLADEKIRNELRAERVQKMLRKVQKQKKNFRFHQ
ncbi:hypothetical protein G9A89_020601 [Geosiphon pyriformis]|nr:hypothetical protein G9A89_020601 [Geosiphon pyriformis]